MINALVEIPTLERAWMHALLDGDLETCASILADDFLLTSSRGIVISKEAWLANAGKVFKCTAFEWQEIVVRPFRGVAVVHGRLHQNASIDRQDWSGVFLTTDVWVKRNHKWQVVSRHETGPVPNEIRVAQSQR